MTIVLYHLPGSPPSRLALITAKVLGVDVTIKIVDLFAGEHLKPEYIKINPQHTVPTLDDNGLILCDSHAIATYLIQQYGKDDSLYPKDPKKRALVDQRLYFNAATLFPRMLAITFPVFFYGKTTIDASDRKNLKEAFELLEKFLELTGWLAGEHVTIADIACATVVSSVQVIGFDLSIFPKTQEWLKRTSNINGFQEGNKVGCEKLGQLFHGKLKLTSDLLDWDL